MEPLKLTRHLAQLKHAFTAIHTDSLGRVASFHTFKAASDLDKSEWLRIIRYGNPWLVICSHSQRSRSVQRHHHLSRTNSAVQDFMKPTFSLKPPSVDNSDTPISSNDNLSPPSPSSSTASRPGRKRAVTTPALPRTPSSFPSPIITVQQLQDDVVAATPETIRPDAYASVENLATCSVIDAVGTVGDFFSPRMDSTSSANTSSTTFPRDISGASMLSFAEDPSRTGSPQSNQRGQARPDAAFTITLPVQEFHRETSASKLASCQSPLRHAMTSTAGVLRQSMRGRLAQRYEPDVFDVSATPIEEATSDDTSNRQSSTTDPFEVTSSGNSEQVTSSGDVHESRLSSSMPEDTEMSLPSMMRQRSRQVDKIDFSPSQRSSMASPVPDGLNDQVKRLSYEKACDPSPQSPTPPLSSKPLSRSRGHTLPVLIDNSQYSPPVFNADTFNWPARGVVAPADRAHKASLPSSQQLSRDKSTALLRVSTAL